MMVLLMLPELLIMEELLDQLIWIYIIYTDMGTISFHHFFKDMFDLIWIINFYIFCVYMYLYL